VCASLEIKTEQTRRLDDDEKALRSMQTLWGTQEMSVINESGLYSLILGSRKVAGVVAKGVALKKRRCAVGQVDGGCRQSCRRQRLKKSGC
jgi:prophage antirepressor-like protein